MSQEKSKTMPMQIFFFFFFWGGGRGKELYCGICASSEFGAFLAKWHHWILPEQECFVKMLSYSDSIDEFQSIHLIPKWPPH